MDNVINLGIPHVGELIFEGINTAELLKFVLVSETWKVLAENVLIKRWKGKMLKACKSGETKVVQLLLDRCNSEESGLNAKDKNGCTAFMWACKNGHKDVVKLLFNNSDRIELNARTKMGYTAFIVACHYGQKDVVKFLLNNSERIELNVRDRYGNNAFDVACHCGHRDVVIMLAEAKEVEISPFERFKKSD